MKCTACGSSSLVEGTILSSDSSELRFYLKESPTLKRMFGIGSKAIHAYGCVHCKNLQFSVEFSENDLERYQQFEGEQPSVLERINSPNKLEG